MLSQAIYWMGRTTLDGGWFYKTQDEWEEETMLTRREQETVRKSLRDTGFWKEELRSVPARLHYRIDLHSLRSALQTSMAESAKLDDPNPPNKDGETSQTLLLTETTAKTTHGEVVPPFQVFWHQYPRKLSRQDAFKAWKKIGGDDHYEKIMISLAAWKKLQQWQEPEFIPYPATWLNSERWKECPRDGPKNDLVERKRELEAKFESARN